MTSNEACLHNPDPAPRTFVVRRPYLPENSLIEFDGVACDAKEPLRVMVPPRGTAAVRVLDRGAASALPGPRRCTIFAGTVEAATHVPQEVAR